MKNMQGIRTYTILFVLTLLLFSCSRISELGRRDYMQWMNDSEKKAMGDKELQGYRFELEYKPAEWLALNEQKNNKNLNKLEFQERLEGLKEMEHYTMKMFDNSNHGILGNAKNPDMAYYQRLEYFTSYAQNDLSLVAGSDTLACKFYHFERYYDLAPYSTIVMAFEKPSDMNLDGDRQLIYDDQVLGLGRVKMNLAADKINELPKLKL